MLGQKWLRGQELCQGAQHLWAPPWASCSAFTAISIQPVPVLVGTEETWVSLGAFLRLLGLAADPACAVQSHLWGCPHLWHCSPLGCLFCCRKFWGEICISSRLFLLALSPWLLSLLLALCAGQYFGAPGTGQEGDKEGTDPMGFTGQSSLPSVLVWFGGFWRKEKLKSLQV